MSEAMYVYIDGQKVEAKDELLAEILTRQEEATVEKENNDAQRNIALSKFEALGLTADDLKALGL